MSFHGWPARRRRIGLGRPRISPGIGVPIGRRRPGAPARNITNAYDVDPHVAEIYDRVERDMSDLDLIRRLAGARGSLRVLEPFCGTGRLLLRLALDGHEVVGMDQSRGMLAGARSKALQLPPDVRRRVMLLRADVVASEWPRGFDLVVLGGNCLYELADAAEQEGVIARAAASLVPGGHVFVDGDHQEGELDPSWRRSGVGGSFPTGVCDDGTRVASTTETVWFDARRRLVRFRRRTRIERPNGDVVEQLYTQQKHPPSAAEVRGWLERHGFVIEGQYGDRLGTPYDDTSERAVYWARKED